ncbi:MAG: IS5 family transposase [Nitrososphaerota archaeon]|nr:IS5 family transposase [Nitrososphaerota archaeon]
MPAGMSWHDYNESLVERGRILFDLGFAASWKKELKSMNGHKVGRPFNFPDSYIEFLGFIKVGFHAPYRMVEGAVEALSEYISFIKDICFSQIRKRIVRLMKGKKPSDVIGETESSEEPITAIVDSTGLTTTTKGAYIEDKWKKEKRKFLKLHILADKKTGKIRGFRVTSERTGDSKKFVPLVKEASKKNKIAKVYGDSAYDARKNFNLLDELEIEPAIKIRKNATTKSLGCQLRRRESLLVKRIGFDGWKKLKDYGKRWIAEIVFSSFKRVLGETLRSRKFLCQKAEASLKVMLYNRFLSA